MSARVHQPHTPDPQVSLLPIEKLPTSQPAASPLTKTTPLSFSFTEKRKEQRAHRALLHSVSVFIYGNKQNWIFFVRAGRCWKLIAWILIGSIQREMSFKLWHFQKAQFHYIYSTFCPLSYQKLSLELDPLKK
jgi:hypothetical protein